MTVNGSGANAAPSGAKRLSSAEAKQTMVDAVPLRRMGTVDDIGQTAAFLASPLASYISGCVVVCDGGSNLAGSGRFNAGAEKMLQKMSATDAVHIFEQGRPDVVFLDLQMPGVDGLALLTFLRRVHPEVPIIIVSANTSHRVAHDCVKVGAFGYVPKPRRAGAAGSAPGDG